jgi:purine nucleosidase
VKIWVDTDIGSEIDDALGLAYLLAKQQVEIVGISVITEQTPIRAMLANAICRAAGQPDIPIHLGCEHSLQGKPFGQTVSQSAALQSLDHQIHFNSYDAVSRLSEIINQNSGELILLAIGPLSNVAQLFELDPQAPNRLRRLVTMCGDFSLNAADTKDIKGGLEWNVRLDPEAAEKIFRTHVRGGHYIVGLETTRDLRMPSRVLTNQSMSAVLQVVHKLHQAGSDVKRQLTMYDLAAAVLAINPGLCCTEKGTASISLTGGRGLTRWQRNQSGHHSRFTAVSEAEVIREFYATFKIRQEYW